MLPKEKFKILKPLQRMRKACVRSWLLFIFVFLVHYEHQRLKFRLNSHDRHGLTNISQWNIETELMKWNICDVIVRITRVKRLSSQEGLRFEHTVIIAWAPLHTGLLRSFGAGGRAAWWLRLPRLHDFCKRVNAPCNRKRKRKRGHFYLPILRVHNVLMWGQMCNG